LKKRLKASRVKAGLKIRYRDFYGAAQGIVVARAFTWVFMIWRIFRMKHHLRCFIQVHLGALLSKSGFPKCWMGRS